MNNNVVTPIIFEDGTPGGRQNKVSGLFSVKPDEELKTVVFNKLLGRETSDKKDVYSKDQEDSNAYCATQQHESEDKTDIEKLVPYAVDKSIINELYSKDEWASDPYMHPSFDFAVSRMRRDYSDYKATLRELSPIVITMDANRVIYANKSHDEKNNKVSRQLLDGFGYSSYLLLDTMRGEILRIKWQKGLVCHSLDLDTSCMTGKLLRDELLGKGFDIKVSHSQKEAAADALLAFFIQSAVKIAEPEVAGWYFDPISRKTIFKKAIACQPKVIIGLNLMCLLFAFLCVNMPVFRKHGYIITQLLAAVVPGNSISSFTAMMKSSLVAFVDHTFSKKRLIGVLTNTKYLVVVYHHRHEVNNAEHLSILDMAAKQGSINGLPVTATLVVLSEDIAPQGLCGAFVFRFDGDITCDATIIEELAISAEDQKAVFEDATMNTISSSSTTGRTLKAAAHCMKYVLESVGRDDEHEYIEELSCAIATRNEEGFDAEDACEFVRRAFARGIHDGILAGVVDSASNRATTEDLDCKFVVVKGFVHLTLPLLTKVLKNENAHVDVHDVLERLDEIESVKTERRNRKSSAGTSYSVKITVKGLNGESVRPRTVGIRSDVFISPEGEDVIGQIKNIA